MSKTEIEIVEAHRTTIEALTGKRCVIKLVSKEELILKTKSFLQIKEAVEKIGCTSILAKTRSPNVVRLRKIFCLLASFAHNQNETRKFLQISYDQVRYYLRRAKTDLQIDAEFKQQFDRVKTILLSSN